MTSLAPARPAFDLSAGAICLDFANTLSDRAGEQPSERLRGYADLLAWGRQSGLLDKSQAAHLARAAESHPAAPEAVLQQAIALREALFHLFAAVAAGESPAAPDLATLNRALADSLGHLRLSPDGSEWRWRWQDDGDHLDRVLWPVARSAAEMLTSDQAGPVRECASPTCRWLFVDGSRNRSRRWCDMSTCGNRSKARRHYQRRQQRERPRRQR